MNSAINRTFYIWSRESLFLGYKKISKKAVKLGSFLHTIPQNIFLWKH